MKIRSRDVPYMTNWKKEIRTKHRYSKRFSKNRTQENFELIKRWRNEATKKKTQSHKSLLEASV